MSLQLYSLNGAKVSEVSETKDCEYGSNANGSWIKYANGVLINFGNIIVTIGTSTTQLVTCFIDYAIPFANNNYVVNITNSFTPEDYRRVMCSKKNVNNSRTLVQLVGQTDFKANDHVSFDFFAIGTWK